MSDIPSTKPYLIRAIFDWCVENGFTPHIMVHVDGSTRVPMAYVRDGRIVLNIAPYATHQLVIGSEELSCQARFGGVAQSLLVPMNNIMAVYARENGQGMAFEVKPGVGDVGVELHADTSQQAADDDVMGEADSADGESQPTPPEPESPPPRSHLRVVK